MATIKEKAIAYDEAIERAKKWYNAPNSDKMPTYANRVIEEIFPELCESEDEMISKKIKKVLNWYRKSFSEKSLRNEEYDEMFAWLEKQKQEPIKVSIWKHWKNGSAGNRDGKLIYLVKNGNTYSLSSCLGFECDYIELSDLDNLMLEKQGEQGTTKEKKPKKDPCIGCYYAINHECAIDIKGYCPREKHFDYENANIQQKDFAPKIEQNPTDNDMVEALRTEYEKGRADAFAQMQKPWSEEDVYNSKLILSTISQDQDLSLETKNILTSWFKSFKQRIGE